MLLDLPGRTLRGEENEEEEYGERLWLDIVFEKLSFFASLTVASLLCYGVLVGKSVEWKLEVRTEETNRTR